MFEGGGARGRVGWWEGGGVFCGSVVDVVSAVKLPEAVSPVDGAIAPNWSVPWPKAFQALAPAVVVKVQVKSVEAPAARGGEERGEGEEGRPRGPPNH